MLIYISVFIISYIFMSLAWKCQKNKILFIGFSLLTILVPSLLAGFRDETVGHDLVHYAVPCWTACAEMKNIAESFVYIYESGLEELYVLYDFILTRFTTDFFWMLFIQMFFIMSLVYLFCYKLRHRFDAPLYFLSYMFFYYCQMMSANRQAFAVALVMFSYMFVMKREKVKFLLCIVFAYGFHHSALLAVLIYPLDIYLSKITKESFAKKFWIVFASGIVFYFIFAIIISYLINIGIFSSKYEKYLYADYNVHKINIVVYIFFFFYIKVVGRDVCLSNKIRLLILISFFITLLGVYNDIATRVALYLDLYWMACFLMLVNGSPAVQRKKPHLAYILAFVALFVYTANGKQKYAEAIPYTSKELGIKE